MIYFAGTARKCGDSRRSVEHGGRTTRGPRGFEFRKATLKIAFEIVDILDIRLGGSGGTPAYDVDGRATNGPVETRKRNRG